MTDDDHGLAHDLATIAGEFLVDYQRRSVGGGRWASDVGAEADAAAHVLLEEELRSKRPADALLSEEGPDDGSRTLNARTWVVDPLDGSEDFGRGAREWAVHVALTEAGRATAAAVAVPGLGATFSTRESDGAIAPDRENLRVVTGRSRSWIDGEVVAGALDAELVVCGSAGVKAMLVVSGHADVYVHAAPLYEWDVCAPAAVARAHGLVAVTPTGGELVFNQARPVVPGVVIARPELVDKVMAAI